MHENALRRNSECDASCRYGQDEKELSLKGPCAQIVYILAPKYLYRDYFKAKVYIQLFSWAVQALRLRVSLGCMFRNIGALVITYTTFGGSLL